MKHLKDFLRQDVGKTLAMTVGSPSVHRRGAMLKLLTFMLLFILGSLNVWGDVTWTRVTAVSELTSGGTFIIGYETTANSGIIIPMANTGSATTSAAGFIYSGSSASSGGTGTIDMSSVSETSNFEVTIVSSGDGNIAIKLGANFLGNSNTKNNAKLFTTDASSNGTSLTPTIGNNNVFTLKNANASYHTLQYNSGSPRFAFYGGGQKNLVIYKKSQSGPAQTGVFRKPFKKKLSFRALI